MSLLARFRRRNVPPPPPPDPNSVNYTPEHVALAKTIARRQKLFRIFWRNISKIQAILTFIAVLWLLALPYEGLWKNTYVDEHALQPAQVAVYFDWANVHKADVYLGELERISKSNSTFTLRTEYLQNAFSAAGLYTGNTTTATYALVTPPRATGMETIIVSANWLSRDGSENLRGIAMLLALGDFLRGQNHWAFDFVLVVGEGYQSGLAQFMTQYHALFSGVIWTGLNIDYPGHSFSHLGVFYEGTNGRLPNQDVINTVSKVAQYTGQVPLRYHNIPDQPLHRIPWLGRYLLAAKHLLHHFAYAALGRASAGHGPLAKYRIDSLTLYCTPATGPHGFHTLGRTLESTLRSFNNLLERLHASYFFYLLPSPNHFIPVGNYLPAAVLLGASLTVGGLDCPAPEEGLGYLVLAFGSAFLLWAVAATTNTKTGLLPIVFSALFAYYPRPRGHAYTSLRSMTLLLYGAFIPTLAMVNFAQSILLASFAHLYLHLYSFLAVTMPPTVLSILKAVGKVDLEEEWEVLGNLGWVGVYVVWVPLWILGVMLMRGKKGGG
ncbi:glycosylphosphatidylinositol transamidase [Cryptococcus bacillisporus CA1873]|uniref:Glycosylphosphatidylinositol transamidase n=1 Tax=Cryptococcus bacillisporus CA1873 TaxID=1296111 RepID=A0ABR5B7L8_CRYGA|nr:glycosylphosphatidylinositol transamidase [Cryptococcus bacillisporus CA1873]|eukprot:KIR59374.1 glycosylphosphatidylinositol transamidase [Cryptococcus gattii CA1873]